MPGKHTPVPRVCQACGRDFIGRVDRPTNIYCSIQCTGIAHRSPSAIQVDGDVERIPLCARNGSIRAYAIIDATDAEWAGQWRWHLSNGYAVRCQWMGGKMREFRLHRELLALTHGDGTDGDHINRVRLDNRRQNLRPLPKGGNGQNQPSERGSSSQYRGVSWDKRLHKWKSYVRVEGKLLHLGFFDSEQEAAALAKATRLRLLPFAVD
jgi:hypothetical protein